MSLPGGAGLLELPPLLVCLIAVLRASSMGWQTRLRFGRRAAVVVPHHWGREGYAAVLDRDCRRLHPPPGKQPTPLRIARGGVVSKLSLLLLLVLLLVGGRGQSRGGGRKKDVRRMALGSL